MKRIFFVSSMLSIFLFLLVGLFVTPNENVEQTFPVIGNIDEINKVNEKCHIKNNTISEDLPIEYFNTINDKKIIVYGNDIDEFNNYLNKEYYLNNKKLYVTLNNEGYTYEVFSVFISKENDYNHTKLLFIDNEYTDHINYLINESIYDKVNIPTGSNIISIQKNIELDKYLIINAWRT